MARKTAKGGIFRNVHIQDVIDHLIVAENAEKLKAAEL